VIDPRQTGIVYAAGSQSLYRTTDGGAYWQAIYTDATLFSSKVVFVLDPLVPGTLYLGAGRALLKSTDSGDHWNPLSLPIPARSTAVIQALVVDPVNPSNLYAGTGKLSEDGEQEKGAIYKSKNGGKSWVRLTEGLPAGSIWSLVVDPAQPQTIYAGISSSLYQSTNRGTSWRQITGYSNGGRILDMLFDPLRSAKLYIGSENGVFLRGKRTLPIALYLPLNMR
jgi:photosystem II stability/assembly factor-like uncharacterized protein